VPGTLATTVYALRDRAQDLRERAARLSCAAEPPPTGAVRFTLPPPEPASRPSGGHLALDLLGFVPVVGAIPDGVNALWYAAEGDGVNAALSAASLVPFAGDAFAAARFVGRSADEVAAALRSSDDPVFTVADLRLNEGRSVSKKSVAHVVRDHVTPSLDEARRRALAEGHPASVFRDEATAAFAIDTAMRANPDEVLAVMSGSAIQRELTAPLSALDDIGDVVAVDGRMYPATHVRVVLRGRPDGAVVVTAFLEAL
jgi:hypothetical protein